MKNQRPAAVVTAEDYTARKKQLEAEEAALQRKLTVAEAGCGQGDIRRARAPRRRRRGRERAAEGHARHAHDAGQKAATLEAENDRLRKALALAQQGFENNASPPCACRLIISTRPR